MGQQFEPTDFKKWVPAQQALTRYRPLANSYAAADLVKRLAEGLIVARAENFIVLFGQPKHYGPERLVPSYVWKAISGQTRPSGLNLWSTGTAEADIFPDGTDTAPVPHKLFGVRFDPAHIALLTRTPNGRVRRPERPVPVSRAALRAWYEAYKLAYPEAERTTDHAWASARGAFPGRIVPRAAVRALLPGGKPGPKGRRTA